MNTYFTFIPLLGIIAFVVLRNPSSAKVSKSERIDFIKLAESIHGAEVTLASSSSYEAPKGVDYSYDVVGESFRRDGLLALVRSHKAFDTGEIYGSAVLELEPTNEFDPTAVKVVVEGTQVGYIPKFDSPAVTEMVKKSGKSSFEVPVRIGWDTNSPSPLIGVRIALTF